jgi:hypothetical protein
MHPHFVHLNNYAIDEINKKFQPTSLPCPNLKVNLQKAISAQVLYDTGADISRLSERVFFAPSQPSKSFKVPGYCLGASGQSLHIAGIYYFEILIRKNACHQKPA